MYARRYLPPCLLLQAVLVLVYCSYGLLHRHTFAKLALLPNFMLNDFALLLCLEHVGRKDSQGVHIPTLRNVSEDAEGEREV